MHIELVIDEIVLHGFDPRQRHTIADAVTAELTRLARAHAAELTGRRSGAIAQTDGPAVRLAPGGPASSTGAGIATSVFSAVRGRTP